MQQGAFEGLKHINIHVIEVPTREIRKKRAGKIFQEIMTETFQKLMQKR